MMLLNRYNGNKTIRLILFLFLWLVLVGLLIVSATLKASASHPNLVGSTESSIPYSTLHNDPYTRSAGTTQPELLDYLNGCFLSTRTVAPSHYFYVYGANDTVPGDNRYTISLSRTDAANGYVNIGIVGAMASCAKPEYTNPFVSQLRYSVRPSIYDYPDGFWARTGTDANGNGTLNEAADGTLSNTSFNIRSSVRALDPTRESGDKISPAAVTASGIGVQYRLPPGQQFLTTRTITIQFAFEVSFETTNSATGEKFMSCRSIDNPTGLLINPLSGYYCRVEQVALRFTIVPPPISASLTCNSVTQTSVTLGWITRNTTNAVITRDSPSATLGAALPITGSGTRVDSGRSPGTSYTYRIRNGSSTGPILGSITCRTLDTPPPVSGTLTCGAITTTSITLNWTTLNTTNAVITRDSPSGTIGTALSSTGSGTRVDSGRSPGTSYTYSLRNNSSSGTILDSITCATTASPPSCDIDNNVRVGGFTLTWTSTNATSASLNRGIGSVATNGTIDVGAIAVTYTLTVTGPGGSDTCETTTVIPPNPSCTLENEFKSGNIWEISWEFSNASSISIDNGIGDKTSNDDTEITITSWGSTTITGTVTNSIGDSSNCTTTINVVRPACVGVVMLRIGESRSDVPAGARFAVQAELENTNDHPIRVTSADYQILSTPTGSSKTSGSDTTDLDIPKDDTNQYNSADPEDIIISGPGDYPVEWVFATPFGPIDCDGTVVVNVEPITCSVSARKEAAGVPFTLKVGFKNDNFIPVNVTKADWSISPTAGVSPSSGSGTIPPDLKLAEGGGTGSADSSTTVTIAAVGTYEFNWTITTDVSGTEPSGGNCGSAEITVSSYPYARFYGNDVIAGGDYGESCTTDKVNAKGYGIGTSHADYKGTASQLAVFAAEKIDKVLPGSQTKRTTLDELAFANSGGATSIDDIGGGFTGRMCADDYPSTSTAGFDSISGTIDLSTLAGGNYVADSNIDIYGTVPEGISILIVAEKDVTITNNITYANAGSWSNLNKIPLLRVYSEENILINSNVSTVTGLYSAEEEIFTCNVSSPNSTCDNPLQVWGSFIAPRVNLWRTNNTVGDSTAQELYDSGTIAESFYFSPELYLAMLARAGANTDGTFDSLISLPPAF